jgi:exopolysaccharide biosynthesis protein
MASVTSNGALLLVTVDGRAAGYSVGMSFPEESAVMSAVGAVDAMNLDGRAARPSVRYATWAVGGGSSGRSSSA